MEEKTHVAVEAMLYHWVEYEFLTEQWRAEYLQYLEHLRATDKSAYDFHALGLRYLAVQIELDRDLEERIHVEDEQKETLEVIDAIEMCLKYRDFIVESMSDEVLNAIVEIESSHDETDPSFHQAVMDHFEEEIFRLAYQHLYDRV
jgi:hypothetical protein